MLAATAAIFPPAIATSRTALVPLFGSMTCPPRSRRSYLVSAMTPPAMRNSAAAVTRVLVFMAQALPEAWRFAEKRASRYSPRLTSPDISSPATLPLNV